MQGVWLNLRKTSPKTANKQTNLTLSTRFRGLRGRGFFFFKLHQVAVTHIMCSEAVKDIIWSEREACDCIY